MVREHVAAGLALRHASRSGDHCTPPFATPRLAPVLCLPEPSGGRAAGTARSHRGGGHGQLRGAGSRATQLGGSAPLVTVAVAALHCPLTSTEGALGGRGFHLHAGRLARRGGLYGGGAPGCLAPHAAWSARPGAPHHRRASGSCPARCTGRVPCGASGSCDACCACVPRTQPTAPRRLGPSGPPVRPSPLLCTVLRCCALRVWRGGLVGRQWALARSEQRGPAPCLRSAAPPDPTARPTRPLSRPAPA